MIKRFLQFLDNLISAFLNKYAKVIPLRITKFAAFYYPDARIRKKFLNKLGVIMGDGTYANLGLKVVLNDDCSPSVIIGNNVSIGPNVVFIPNSEPNNSPALLNNEYVKTNLIKKKNTIHVEDNVWLGANCVIMPGFTIKQGSIIGAGAVVTQDTEEFSIYAGVPAKKIRNIKND